MSLIDAHAHLSDIQDIQNTVKKAKDTGIKAIIAVSANLSTCKLTKELSNVFPDFVYPAYGIHPTEWYTEDVDETMDFIVRNLESCIAIGEIGLDYWNVKAKKSKDIRNRQRQIYIDLLKIAKEHDKPVSVHGRGSWSDALKLANKYGPEKIVFHWYSGSHEILEEIHDASFYISATPALEFSKYHKSAIEKAHLENIIIETDCPVYLRNRRRLSEPQDLQLTLRALAKFKNSPEDEISKITTKNASEFFKI
jgi:TatD DNase family protein